MSIPVVITHQDCRRHRPGIRHPEGPERLSAVLNHLPPGIPLLTSEPASAEDLAYAHQKQYIDSIRELSAAGAATYTDPDTVLSPGTWRAALGAVGAMRWAVENVVSGQTQRVFCAVRPPGHHAEWANTKGFCFFNTIAIGARMLQRRYGVRRIAIIDWDAHHGNGTQDTFYDDAGVLYVSLHQYPLFPGTGRRSERGKGAGAGYNLNIPLAPGSTDHDACQAFRDEAEPAIAAYRPEVMMVSAGFDGHVDERLAGWMMTASGYADLTRRIVALADRYSDGRVISLLEGGYHLPSLIACVNEHLRELCSRKSVGAPLTNEH